MMAAPAGVCGSCGSPMQWSVEPVSQGGILVRCQYCADLFESGMDIALGVREGHEAGLLDGRPIRSLLQIAKDRAECEDSF